LPRWEIISLPFIDECGIELARTYEQGFFPESFSHGERRQPSTWLAGCGWRVCSGVLAALEANRIGLYLVPPFGGATLSILFLAPSAAIAQPYALIVGSVAGTLMSLFARGLGVAVVAAVVAFG
jgi:CBS-domain-containing membrane protein